MQELEPKVQGGLTCEAIPIWCFVSWIQWLNNLPIWFINVNLCVVQYHTCALCIYQSAIAIAVLPRARGWGPRLLSWGDGRPAVGQCRDKAWECCAGITVLPSTTKDTFGSLLHKVGNSRLDTVDSLELQAETVEKDYYIWSCCLYSPCGTTQCTCSDGEFCISTITCIKRSWQCKHEILKVMRMHHVLIVSLRLQLEGSELQLTVVNASSPGVFMLKPHWVKKKNTRSVNLKATIPVKVPCFHQPHCTTHLLSLRQTSHVITVLMLSTIVHLWSNSNLYVLTAVALKRL